jgi:hypothetical protein
MIRWWLISAASVLTACAPHPPIVGLNPSPTEPTLTTSVFTTTPQPTFTTTTAVVLPTLAPPVEPTLVPTALITLTATATQSASLQPLVSFDATPTREVLSDQTALPSSTTPASSVSVELWRSVTPAATSARFEGVDVVGGTLTVPYPSGWQISGDANGLIVTNTDIDALRSQGLTGQQAAIYITVIPNDLAPLAVAAGLEPSAPLILANFIAQADTIVENAIWSQILITRAGTRPAALVSGTNADDDALIVSAALEGGYALITAVTDRGQMAAVLPVVALMAREITYR